MYSNWSECKWIAHTDLRITESASVLKETLNKGFIVLQTTQMLNQWLQKRKKCSFLYYWANKMKLDMLWQEWNKKTPK
jgi:hypothetical protein